MEHKLTYSTTADYGRGGISLLQGRYEVIASFDVVLLPREYTINIGVHHQNGATSDFVTNCLKFQVLPVAEFGSDHYPWQKTRGFVRANANWHLEGVK